MDSDSAINLRQHRSISQWTIKRLAQRKGQKNSEEMPLPGMEVPANKKIVSSQKIIFLSDFNVDDDADDLSALKRCPCVHVVGNDKLHTRTVAAESSCATEWLRGRELGSS